MQLAISLAMARPRRMAGSRIITSKLISYGPDRPTAIAKMKRALEEFYIAGIKTTIPFHLKLMKDENFIKGNYTTKFLEDFDLTEN